MPATVKVESGKRPRRATARRVPPPEPKLGALQGFIGFNLRLAQDASFRVFARKSGQRDIMPGRFAALMVLRDNPNITQSALGRAIARDKSSVTPLLQDLQRRGLVKRMRSITDRRSVTLTLTAAGARVLQDLIQHAAVLFAAGGAFGGGATRSEEALKDHLRIDLHR